MFYLVGLGTGLVSFFVGCIWYTAILGKAWQKGMGFSDEKVKSIFKPQRIIAAILGELAAALCTVGILYNLPPAIPPIVKAVMVMVVVVGSGVKLAIFDGKKAGIILINEGYKIISILLFFISLTLFGQYIVF
jgi:ABC-type lipoprotein release transport system permease subunit